MTLTEPLKPAVTYCRVASTEVDFAPLGLAEQEARCRAYADAFRFSVEKTFIDTGVDGSLDSPGWQATLDYVRSKPEGCFVIVDDITRLSRSIAGYSAKQTELRAAGGTLQSPSLPLGDTPEGRLIENLAPALSEFIAAQNLDGDLPDEPVRFTRRRWIDRWWPVYGRR